MIPFNVAPCLDKSLEYITKAAKSSIICGDGPYTKACSSWIENTTGVQKALLTTSGTASLEMAARLCDLKLGDEVIMPSFTFSSTANAVIMCNAKPVFVDIRPDTLNIDEAKIEAAITPKTKAILVVHYAGVACEMDKIMEIAQEYNLFVIEDAAHAVMSKYKDRPLGTIGHFGCYSFHETKNYSMGEGGALLIRDEKYNEKAEIMREKGTDRSKFFRGQVDKYQWIDYGSSYLPSDLNAAYLLAQLEIADAINVNRINTWNLYYEKLKKLKETEKIELPYVPSTCVHNAHLFYIKCRDLNERSKLISNLKNKGIETAFHYVPLHSSPAGEKYCRFAGVDEITTKESERVLRLPLYYGLKLSDLEKIVFEINAFYN